MRKLLFLLFILCVSDPSIAQWRNIANFIDSSSGLSEEISSVYFIGLPGPPRVGFAGTQPELWETTDGGEKWFKSFANDEPDYSTVYVNDICFKDSLTGWFLYSTSVVYRTTNGGESWQAVSALPQAFLTYGANDIHYCSSANRLLVSGLVTGAMAVSTDGGNSWSTTNAGEDGYFSFSNDSMGIMSCIKYEDSLEGIQDTLGGILRTTDAGESWSLTENFFGCWQPLAIPGTSICFAAGATGLYQTEVYRSDDYGQTWRRIYSFPFWYDSSIFTEIAPVEEGYIHGDLSHLYIDSDSGMFTSTDEGMTWSLMKGSTNLYVYCVYNGSVFAGEDLNNAESGGLWEEDTGVVAGVAESNSQDGSCFDAMGPYTNPSEPSENDVSVLVHYCGLGLTITAQVYTMMGVPIGPPSTYTSDGQEWDRIPITAPPIAGTYYITTTVGSYSSTLGYSVY
jgi:photosystem II stability/assembly factor-like uncharacterized protein